MAFMTDDAKRAARRRILDQMLSRVPGEQGAAMGAEGEGEGDGEGENALDSMFSADRIMGEEGEGEVAPGTRPLSRERRRRRASNQDKYVREKYGTPGSEFPGGPRD